VWEREREREIVPGMWERKREESRRARRDLNNAAMAEAGIEWWTVEKRDLPGLPRRKIPVQLLTQVDFYKDKKGGVK
jgi:hypothetical protein